MNNSVNFYAVSPQISFSAKNFSKKNYFKIIDDLSDKAVKLASKDKPVAEKKETAIRKSLERIFKKLGFGEKLRNAGKEKPKTQNSLKVFIKGLKFRKNPDEVNIQIMRKSLEDIGRFFGEI